MKILYLSQRIPYPPNKGDKLRAFNEIKHLSKHHEISLFCLTDNYQKMGIPDELNQLCKSIDVVHLSKIQSKLQSSLAIFSDIPLTLSYFYSKKLKEMINMKLIDGQYDLIFVYCSSMAQYVDHVQHIPKLIDFVDVDSEKWNQYATYASFPMRLLYRIESYRLRKYEALIAENYQHGIFVSENEAADFKKMVCPCSTITPILNGVDCEMFTPGTEPYERNSLIFTGAMDYYANVEAVLYFVDQILPLIKNKIDNVKFYIVGSNPTKEIILLAKKDTSIIVTGYVEAVQPYMSNAAVFVAPMRIARGVQNKILEAMAMGVPVVTSSLGYEGITAKQGEDIFVEDTPELFAMRVIELVEDAELRRAVSEKSRKNVESCYNWQMNLGKLEELLIETQKAFSSH
ncbi:TIGR03087 family PEP-CTERM/XrtA system glycosyltransferase [Geobacter sp. AOG2]|uniref:TIGR03087 family PEP-CTERM/XrtA system glycosyltransferase n=1 Tax=Geobacter sp. AOG2 TaxID=1566347 RepID=UPI001CC77703|nr:TIGR03087 family PEP-CTERM/XrtA system glycosyltransferase [Geobacter sp. AOG2]GFE60842.1 glycosyl transferase [Geobacter sp. AOG2]